MGRPNDRDRPDDDRRNERDRDRDKTYERDRDHERGRRAAGPPPNEGYTWHHAVQGGWQLSFGHHAPGHPPGRLECPALLYDPTVFDVVLVPHPLVPQVTGMVNEYMRTRPPLSHSDTRYYGEDQSQKKSTPTAPLQCQSHRGNQLTDATLERMDPRQSTSFAQRPSIPSAPPSAQRRIPPPTPSYYHEDIENIRPASQLHQQPLPPQRQPQPQPQYPIPRPQQPPPHLQPHPQPQPHSAMQAAPNRQYYRPSAWPNGRSFLPQDSIPPLPTPRLKSVSDRRMSASSSRAPSPMVLDDDDDEPSEEEEDVHMSAEDARPKSPYYDTEGESEVDEDVDELDDDNDDGNGPGRPPVRRGVPARRGRKRRAPAPRSVAPGPFALHSEPQHTSSLNLAPSAPQATDNDDINAIMFGERPRRAGSTSGSGSGAGSVRSASPSDDADVAMSDPPLNLPPRARRQTRKRARRATRRADASEPALKRARGSSPVEGTSNTDVFESMPSNLSPDQAACLWPLPRNDKTPLPDMRRRLPSGSYKLCNCILNLRRQNESKKHIVAHILELKGQGLTGEHIKCPWPECTQYAKLENLARHISHVHLRLNFLCRFCGKSLARKDALKRHCASQHPNMIHGDFPLGEDQDEDEPEEAAPMEGCVQEQSAAEHVQQAEITQQAQQDGVIYIQAQQEEVVQEQAQQEQQEQQEGPEGQAQQEEVAQVLTQQGYDHDQSNDGSVQHGTDAAA